MSEAQLQSFAQTLSTECEDQTPEPPAQNRAAPAAPDEREEDTNYPLMAALFRDDQKRRAKARSARDEWNKAVEARRREWERWLRDVYASGPCVRSDAFRRVFIEGDGGRRDEVGHRRRAEAAFARRGGRAHGPEDARRVGRRLRAREAEVAGATGSLEVKASRCEQALSALIARRDALSSFAKSRDASANARTEAQASQEATRERLRNELDAAEAAEVLAASELKKSVEAEAADRGVGRAASNGEGVWLIKKPPRTASPTTGCASSRRRLEDASAPSRRATPTRALPPDEAGIADAALRSLEEEVLPHDRRGVERAVEQRKAAERALADHRRAAAASLHGLEAESDWRRDESEAVSTLGPLLSAPNPFGDDGFKNRRRRRRSTTRWPRRRGRPSPRSMICSRRRAPETKDVSGRLEAALKAASQEEAALRRVLDSSLTRRDGLRRAARDARRGDWVALRRTRRPSPTRPSRRRRRRPTRARLEPRPRRRWRTPTPPRRRSRRGSGAARAWATKVPISGARRRASGCGTRWPRRAPGGSVEGVLADDDAPEPASSVARAELDRVEAVIVVHSRERDDLRGEVAKLQQAWEAESARPCQASLRGAEAQVKSHADDARAAAATHDARRFWFFRECEFPAAKNVCRAAARARARARLGKTRFHSSAAERRRRRSPCPTTSAPERVPIP